MVRASTASDMCILHGQVDEIRNADLACWRCMPRRASAPEQGGRVRAPAAWERKLLRTGGLKGHVLQISPKPCWELFVTSLWETIVVVGISGVVGALLAFLGVFLRVDRPWRRAGKTAPSTSWWAGAVNAVRSTPFIILLLAIIPLTRFVTGSASIGNGRRRGTAHHAAAPFVARLVESALRERHHALSRSHQAMAQPPARSSGRCCRGAARHCGGPDHYLRES